MIVLEVIFFLSLLIILYHFCGYPLLLRFFAGRRQAIQPGGEEPLNNFIFVIPMYNEEIFIAKKIENLAHLDYPSTHYRVILIDDGSTDSTLVLAKTAAKKYPNLLLEIQTNAVNQGKVALYNQVIPDLFDDAILMLSDVSALLSENVLQRANAFFNNPKVGAFSVHYILDEHALHGEQTYWDYQSKIQSLESRLGSPIGYHGTGYAIRKSLWEPLFEATINDDFVMPMKVITKGYLGVFDEGSSASEIELSSEQLDWNRRVRIATGNIQQVFYLREMLAPRHGFIAWMFFSGKVLRVFLPWLFISLFLSALLLSFSNVLIFNVILAVQCLVYLVAFINSITNLHSKLANIITYFIKGQVSIFMGWLRFPRHSGHWMRANAMPKSSFVHPVIRIIKWIIDKSAALVGLFILLLLLPWIALLIKRASPGPIFYKQLRVGRSSEKSTHLFYLYKFRTMNCDLAHSHLKWTAENDPRIFPLGRFLRRTHLDELPQFFNILKGDMSLVGPRPERPCLYPYIENNIPFYSERLYGILPGMTGLAQVSRGPDRVIEDVREKVAYDHAYAIHLTKPWIWIKLEFVILLKTLKLVLVGKEL